MITTASYSRLQVFEQCALRAKLQYVDKIPDPMPRTAADRGTAIHLEAEHFTNGTIPDLPSTLNKFRDEFYSLKTSFLNKQVSLEGEWGFDANWQVTDYRAAWMRIKADAVVSLTPDHSVVIDFKTGRKFGNEIKHGEQLQLYALATFIRNPYVQKVTAELWYLDQDDITTLEIPRSLAINKYLKLYDRRAKQMTNASRFEPNPNIHSCKYCPYGPRGTGHCKVGV
jgi:CRISPR/Cas system-associated exonuclease Cas4 (RecB family)